MSETPKLPIPTCPDIDRVIHWIRRALKAAEDALRADPNEQTEELAKEVETALDGWDSTLEELREANSGLRVYGEYWKDEADKRTAKVDELEEREIELSEVKLEVLRLTEDLKKSELTVDELQQSVEVGRRALVG